MRTKYLFLLFAVLAALLLPCAAHAQCSDFYCETFAVYNPGSGTITGYSLYDDYGISWGWWLEVQSYVSDPTGYNNPVGQSWGYDYVEVDFCYTATMNGGYTAWGYNYYDLEVWWVYDGDSYSPGVYVSGPPGQQITSCPSPSWVLGGNNVAIYGSGFSQATPSLSWSGNDGVNFLNGDSWVQVYSDVEIMVYADLLPLSTQGTLTVYAGIAACPMAVPPIPPPPPSLSCPQTVTRGGSATCTLGGTIPAGAQWTFTDANGYVNPGPVGAAQWAGTMAISGTVSVSFANSPTQSASITVSSRTGWGTPTASAATAPTPNGTNVPDCALLQVSDPPQTGNPLGLACVQLPQATGQFASIGSGPNQGYAYVYSNQYAEAFFYTITPQLLSTGSSFYTAQCGNYNPTTNPGGYIGGPLLLTNVTQHENGQPGHYGQYVQARGYSVYNEGFTAETTVANPSQSIGDIFGGDARTIASSIRSLTDSDAALCGGEATEVPPACTFNGQVNYSPYAACI